MRLLALLLLGAAVVGLVFLPEILQEVIPLGYPELISLAEQRHGVDWALIAAVIQVESGFSPAAVSKKGAVGLMQIMPDTAAWVSARLGESVAQEDLVDPKVNIHLGTYYLRYLLTALPLNRRRLPPTTGVPLTCPAGWKKALGMVPMGMPTAYPFPKPGLMYAECC